MTYFVTFKAQDGRCYTVTIYECETKNNTPEEVAAQRIKEKMPEAEIEHLSTVKVGDGKRHESNKGKIVVKMLDEDNKITYSETSVEDFVEMMYMGDGEYDFDMIGWWMGKSDQKAFDEALERWNGGDVAEVVREFLKIAEDGLLANFVD